MDFDTRKLTFAVWIALIAFLTLTPVTFGGGVGLASSTHNMDKLVHASLFFVFALLAFRVRSEPSVTNYTFIVTVALLYGLSIEYAQLFIPGRAFEALDAFADVAGASAFFVGLLVLQDARPEVTRRLFG